MGNVHAKSMEPVPVAGPERLNPFEERGMVEPEPVARHEIVLTNKPIVVQRVSFNGLRRTKDDFLMPEIAGLFDAVNLMDVMQRSHEARLKMLRLGIFNDVQAVVDVAKGPGARLDGLEITFQVTEMSALTGSYNTMVGNNEGSMAIGGKLSNMLGRAERLVAQFSYGTKETSYGLSFFKPHTGCFERNITFGLFDVKGQFPWSSVREVDRGVSFDFNFPVWRTRHALRWEAVWRELSCLSRTASFPVREESGHSLKSSLAHTMVVDCRDSTILPSKGVYLKVNQELAGYTGGDIRFLKEEMELQLNRSLPWGCVLSGSLWGGLLMPFGERPSCIADRFFLGGPTTIRGFNMYSIGPYAESDFLGGDAYWAAGLHLYTPLPFGPGRSGFGDIFRTHLFINAGNLCSLDYGEGLRGHVSRLGSCLRWAYGAGVVLRLGNIARLELNYCFPTGVQLGDRICDGVQFGAGIRFL